MTNWISIKDKMPAKKTFVLVTDGNKIRISKIMKSALTIYALFGYGVCGEMGEITHWSYLPRLPNVKLD